ncbi:uncharacterized protein [Heterodontus francisci]|uniref:uncharacterized protein n=1 Tax=Heterodontus francisci TaxID=7792 RepID=UPI00355BA954
MGERIQVRALDKDTAIVQGSDMVTVNYFDITELEVIFMLGKAVENTNMAASVDKSHSTMWARFHSESPNKVVKLLRKIPLTKWEVLLRQHGEDILLHPKRNSSTSRSCPSLLCRPESAAAFTVHSVVQSRIEGIPNVAIQAEDVSGEEKNQFAAAQDCLTLQSARCTDDDSKIPEEVNQKDAFFSWALERAEKSNIKDQAFEEFEVEEKEGLILENDYLSPTVSVHKLVNQRTKEGAEDMEETMAGRSIVHSEYFDTKKEAEHKEIVPGVDTKHDDIQKDQAYQKMEVAAKPEHLEQIGSMETFEYSFTKSKRKSYCAEEEMKLVMKDKAEIDYKNKQTKFALEHYQGLDVDLKYSEELFDEIDDDEDSAELETQTILCLPFLCWKRRNKHKEDKQGTSCFGR